MHDGHRIRRQEDGCGQAYPFCVPPEALSCSPELHPLFGAWLPAEQAQAQGLGAGTETDFLSALAAPAPAPHICFSSPSPSPGLCSFSCRTPHSYPISSQTPPPSFPRLSLPVPQLGLVCLSPLHGSPLLQLLTKAGGGRAPRGLGLLPRPLGLRLGKLRPLTGAFQKHSWGLIICVSPRPGVEWAQG